MPRQTSKSYNDNTHLITLASLFKFPTKPVPMTPTIVILTAFMIVRSEQSVKHTKKAECNHIWPFHTPYKMIIPTHP